MIQEANYEDVILLRQEVMYPNQNLDYVRLPDDEKGIHIGYFENTQLVSVVSLFLEGRNLQFRKLATKTQYQNQGYASKLIDWIVEYAVDLRFSKVWCNAREEKTAFYTKRGFTETDRTFQKASHTYIVMEKIIPPIL